VPAEAHVIERPSDLIPLGVVHNDEFRAALMIAVEQRRRRFKADLLWGFDDSTELRPVPAMYVLNWIGGPARDEREHPEYPGLLYYCDVTAYDALRGVDEDVGEFTEVRISKQVLREIRLNLQPEWPLGVEKISFFGAASVIEPFFSLGPMWDHRKRDGQGQSPSDWLSDSERQRLQPDPAVVRDLHDRAPATRDEESARSYRVNEMAQLLLRIGQSLDIEMFRHVNVLCSSESREPDKNWGINRAGFLAVKAVLFGGGTPKVTKGTTPSIGQVVERKPIPISFITEYFNAQKSASRPPSQEKAKKEIEAQYPRYRVTRQPIVEAHRDTFPGLKPGKRRTRNLNHAGK
jgi:hypothetical protein